MSNNTTQNAIFKSNEKDHLGMPGTGMFEFKPEPTNQDIYDKLCDIENRLNITTNKYVLINKVWRKV